MLISSCGVWCDGGGIVYVLIGGDDGDGDANSKVVAVVVCNRARVAHSDPCNVVLVLDDDDDDGHNKRVVTVMHTMAKRHMREEEDALPNHVNEYKSPQP